MRQYCQIFENISPSYTVLDTTNRGQEQEGGLTNWTKRSDTIRVAFVQITEFVFFEKINFFDFGGPKKLFSRDSDLTSTNVSLSVSPSVRQSVCDQYVEN